MKRPFDKHSGRRHDIERPDDARTRDEDRFFIEQLPLGDGRFELDGDEAVHVAGSRRMRAGDAITLFDGSGWDVSATIVEASARRVILEAVARRMVGAPMAVPITCAAALPKGAREDLLVSKCAELGVARLVPVEFERSVVHAEERWEKRRERFRRLAIEAAKQSGASTLMEVGEPVTLQELVSVVRGLRLIGMPKAQRGVVEVLGAAWPFEEAVCLVGPEGGITGHEESAAVEAGFTPVRLAVTTLRIETACMAFAAVAAAFLAGRQAGSADA